MSKNTLPKWTEERTATLISLVGETTPVTPEVVAQAVETLGEGTTSRSVAAKLRKEGYDVESTAKSTGKSYTDEEEAEILDFLNSHPNQYTYAEIASQVLGGSRTAKQIQGKILSMEKYTLVKATEKVERPKSYTDEEEAKLEKLVRAGGFIEDIADTMDRPINSIRGKILSMLRKDPTIKIPKQKEYVTKKVDAFTALGDVSEMTVEQIAEAIDKSSRGVKTLLTHRGVDCVDHKGARKKAVIDEKKAAAEA